MGESKKGRKESSWSKKLEEMCRKVFWPDNIWTIQNCHQMNKRKKRKPWPKVVFSLWLPTKIPCASDPFFSPRTKQKKKKEKEKARKIKSQKHTKAEKKTTKRTHSQGKPYWSMITHVIFDLIGNNLQSQVMTYLWFGIRMKHLPVRDWYTLSDFLLFLSNPVFPLNGHLETKC